VLNLLVFAVAAHSVVAGVVLMGDPQWMLSTVGWPYEGELFWPRQAGLFLAILGLAYGAALRLPPLVWLVVGSKACAFIFLMTHAIWLDAPRPVWWLGAGDGLMGLSVAAALWYSRREAARGTDHERGTDHGCGTDRPAVSAREPAEH
jgi:hypothetical protein